MSTAGEIVSHTIFPTAELELKPSLVSRKQQLISKKTEKNHMNISKIWQFV